MLKMNHFDDDDPDTLEAFEAHQEGRAERVLEASAQEEVVPPAQAAGVETPTVEPPEPRLPEPQLPQTPDLAQDVITPGQAFAQWQATQHGPVCCEINAQRLDLSTTALEQIPEPLREALRQGQDVAAIEQAVRQLRPELRAFDESPIGARAARPDEVHTATGIAALIQQFRAYRAERSLIEANTQLAYAGSHLNALRNQIERNGGYDPRLMERTDRQIRALAQRMDKAARAQGNAFGPSVETDLRRRFAARLDAYEQGFGSLGGELVAHLKSLLRMLGQWLGLGGSRHSPSPGLSEAGGVSPDETLTTAQPPAFTPDEMGGEEAVGAAPR